MVDLIVKGPHRDFVLLIIYISTQHHQYGRAYALVRAMIAQGDDSPEIHLAHAVLLFYLNDYPRALESLRHLDLIAPIERFDTRRMDARCRMRGFLKARCLHEVRSIDDDERRAALKLYLRHSVNSP